MKQSAVKLLIESIAFDEKTKYLLEDYIWKAIFKTALLDEMNQRQEDTNHGYAQGYDDGAAGKEPMRPGVKDESDDECCPHCGECENIHTNYDYYQKHRPVEEFLCNECGKYFPPKSE